MELNFSDIIRMKSSISQVHYFLLFVGLAIFVYFSKRYLNNFKPEKSELSFSLCSDLDAVLHVQKLQVQRAKLELNITHENGDDAIRTEDILEFYNYNFGVVAVSCRFTATSFSCRLTAAVLQW